MAGPTDPLGTQYEVDSLSGVTAPRDESGPGRTNQGPKDESGLRGSGGSWLSKYLRPGPSAEQSLCLPYPSDLVSEKLTSYYD